VCRFFPEAEVERIFRRNGFLFQLRNLRTLGSLERLWARLIDLDSVSFSELTSCRKIVSVFLARIRAAWEPFSDHSLEYATHSYHHLPHSELHHRPTVLTVSPYALFPPSHGGAVRLDRLLGVVARECNIVLLSDEAEDHSPRSAPYLCRFAEIHLVGNRREPQGQDRISRIRAHSRSLLKERLAALDRALQPDLIQVEFSELAGLAAVRRDAPPWLITLHEVQFSADSPGAEDLYELGLLSHYDGIIACSPEDQSLIPFESTRLVANGVDACIPYSSSSGNRSILFAGPFRYRPNFEGILAFLESVYPELLKRLPAPELWILGGPEALHLAKSARAFRQRGVVLYDYYQDPRPFLEKAAVTINPLVGIRGSSIKLLESIAAGRVVVSTRDGARGFGTEPFPSLIVVEKVQDFLAPLERLLLDESYRLRLEPPDRELLAAHSWEAAGDCLLDVYRSYIEGGCHR
jgi:glycosyltransferase involved in cell wall biosynthesis